MIYIKGNSVDGIYIKNTPVSAVYVGKELVWPDILDVILSCYYNGYWIDEYPWTDDTPWTD